MINKNINKQNANVLYVGKECKLVSSIKNIFGYQNILCLSEGNRILSEICNAKPDLIIFDLILDSTNDIELCRSIKSNYTTNHIPVILLSPKISLKQKINGLIAGVDAYIEKPVETEYLIALIDNILTQRRKLIQRFSIGDGVDKNNLFQKESNNAFLEKIDTIINKNISDPEFSMDHIIEAMNTSRSQLYRKFKQLVNKNPGEYIRQARLKHSMKLLSSQKYSVCEIADMSGFGNVSNFITCFKKQYGKSPRKYINAKFPKERVSYQRNESLKNRKYEDDSQDNFFMFSTKNKIDHYSYNVYE